MFWGLLFALGVLVKRNNGTVSNSTISFFFTADPQFGWGSSYSGNEERYSLSNKKGKVIYFVSNKPDLDYFSIMNPKMYELNKSIEIYTDCKCYYRCEVELETYGDNKKFALTNPIWLSPIIKEDTLN